MFSDGEVLLRGDVSEGQVPYQSDDDDTSIDITEFN